MVSLNNLDEQIGALEEEEEEVEDDPVDELAEEVCVGKSQRKRSQPEDLTARPASKPPESLEQSGEVKEKKKRKDKNARNAVCFRYFEGKCKFDDCKFLHVSPSKLTHDERAQVLRELPLRPYSKGLAEVIAALNIPRCKDFHQRGGCKQPKGKCHFWHLTDATAARWAGFGFWCDLCSKAFTSKDQMQEHKDRAPMGSWFWFVLHIVFFLYPLFGVWSDQGQVLCFWRSPRLTACRLASPSSGNTKLTEPCAAQRVARAAQRRAGEVAERRSLRSHQHPWEAEAVDGASGAKRF